MKKARQLLGMGCPDCSGGCVSMAGLGSSQYLPITGDVVNVLVDVVGKKTDGTQYVIKAGSFFTPNVVQIETSSVAKNYLKINDGTDNSPIYATYMDNQNSFELANFINQKIFAPYSGAAKVVSSVATAAADTVQNTAQAVSNTSKAATYLVPLIVIGGVLFVGAYAYKNYIKGNDKIKVPRVI